MPDKSLFAKIFQPDYLSRNAILYEYREITYSELRELTIQTAAGLQALGIRPGDRVGMLLHDSPEFIASFLAIVSLGAIAVPINMALRKPEQRFILNDCGARIAIVEIGAVGKLFDGAENLPDDLESLMIVNRDASELPKLERVRTYDFYAGGRSSLDDDYLIPAREDDDAFILYTSGSTGEPKGAVHSVSNIFYTNETFCQHVLRLGPGDRLFSSSRLPFAYGLGNAFTFPLLNGHTTILCREKPSAETIARIFREQRPSIFFGVPVVYRMLLDHLGAGNELNTSSLRLCISAGEALPAQLGEDWEKASRVPVLDGIGSTEMLHMFISNKPLDNRYGSSGKTVYGYAANIKNHDGGPALINEVGSLWINGGSAASRYWQRPELTAETFVKGWVRTGDLYLQDEKGSWWHQGRSDDCFKTTGQWVSPVEVEGVLLKTEKIRAAAVVEGLDKDNLSCVCAFVVRANENDGEEIVEQALRALCESALPRFKQPRRYIFVSELPYTATGKVQRFKLREQLRSGHSTYE